MFFFVITSQTNLIMDNLPIRLSDKKNIFSKLDPLLFRFKHNLVLFEIFISVLENPSKSSEFVCGKIFPKI